MVEYIMQGLNCYLNAMKGTVIIYNSIIPIWFIYLVLLGLLLDGVIFFYIMKFIFNAMRNNEPRRVRKGIKLLFLLQVIVFPLIYTSMYWQIQTFPKVEESYVEMKSECRIIQKFPEPIGKETCPTQAGFISDYNRDIHMLEFQRAKGRKVIFNLSWMFCLLGLYKILFPYAFYEIYNGEHVEQDSEEDEEEEVPFGGPGIGA